MDASSEAPLQRSRESLDKAARELAEICRSGGADVLYRVGEHIIRHLYGGNVGQWRRVGTRDASYRHLAARSDVPLSASALCRAVGVYELYQRLGGANAWQHLTASHFQEVLPLDGDRQDDLLRQAEQEKWSVRRLRVETAKLRAPSDRRRATRWAREVKKIHAIASGLALPPPVTDDAAAASLLDEVERALAMLSDRHLALRSAVYGEARSTESSPASNFPAASLAVATTTLPAGPDRTKRDSYVGWKGGDAAAAADDEVPSSRQA